MSEPWLTPHDARALFYSDLSVCDFINIIARIIFFFFFFSKAVILTSELLLLSLPWIDAINMYIKEMNEGKQIFFLSGIYLVRCFDKL